MSPHLLTVCKYIELNNANDLDALTALFTPDAVVQDEARTHRGTRAIHAWLSGTKAQYSTRLALVQAVDQAAVVTARLEVSGTFPGSPITLSHRFTLDNNHITSLEIG